MKVSAILLRWLWSAFHPESICTRNEISVSLVTGLTILGFFVNVGFKNM